MPSGSSARMRMTTALYIDSRRGCSRRPCRRRQRHWRNPESTSMTSDEVADLVISERKAPGQPGMRATGAQVGDYRSGRDTRPTAGAASATPDARSPRTPDVSRVNPPLPDTRDERSIARSRVQIRLEDRWTSRSHATRSSARATSRRCATGYPSATAAPRDPRRCAGENKPLSGSPAPRTGHPSDVSVFCAARRAAGVARDHAAWLDPPGGPRIRSSSAMTGSASSTSCSSMPSVVDLLGAIVDPTEHWRRTEAGAWEARHQPASR